MSAQETVSTTIAPVGIQRSWISCICFVFVGPLRLVGATIVLRSRLRSRRPSSQHFETRFWQSRTCSHEAEVSYQTMLLRIVSFCSVVVHLVYIFCEPLRRLYLCSLCLGIDRVVADCLADAGVSSYLLGGYQRASPEVRLFFAVAAFSTKCAECTLQSLLEDSLWDRCQIGVSSHFPTV